MGRCCLQTRGPCALVRLRRRRRSVRGIRNAGTLRSAKTARANSSPTSTPEMRAPRARRRPMPCIGKWARSAQLRHWCLRGNRTCCRGCWPAVGHLHSRLGASSCSARTNLLAGLASGPPGPGLVQRMLADWQSERLVPDRRPTVLGWAGVWLAAGRANCCPSNRYLTLLGLRFRFRRRAVR